ncbi:MAG TPA: CHAP domain-containing protein [Galbitalea sp.]|jgi:surface antigen|nr:CHAP domain-containing protein [Galbitalea sp.]
MARMGMDVDAVAAAGHELQAKAQSIDSVVSNLDGIVNKLNGVWAGKDAEVFINEWWPAHKKDLTAASTSISGLGQSALNNASEQRQVSTSAGAAIAGVAGIAAAGGAAAASGGSSSSTTSTADNPGATSGSLAPISASEAAAYHQFESQTYPNAKYGEVDGNGKPPDNCTSWADWRREQLGLSGTSGTGGEMAGNLGGTTSTPPTLGALGSYDPSDSKGAGHVFVVEGVTSNNPPTIQISEANYEGSPDIHPRTLTQGADGNWYGQGMGTNGYPITFSPAS